jgi:hypothetical protein
MMRSILKAALLVGLMLAMTASGAGAQQATDTGTKLHVEPNGSVTTLNRPAGGFDWPQPALKLDVSASHDAVAGLAPGEDLVGRSRPVTPSLSAAETDSYFATKEYQDKAQTVERKGHTGAGKQFAGAAKAMAGQALLQGIGTLLQGD